MTPEFSRMLPLSRIGRAGAAMDIAANEAERALLAKRLGIAGIEALRCQFQLHALPGGAIAADGVLTARVIQICVVSLDPFAQDIAESFTLRFVPEASLTASIDPETEDEIPIVGDALDLGEAAAEQLALSLDPYPRSPGAALPA
jgi:uncharacterized metal-binding protein YceD (DUF177 family)